MLGGKTLHILRQIQKTTKLWEQHGSDGWFALTHNAIQTVKWNDEYLSDATLRYQLTKLVNEGYLERRGTKPRGYFWWYEYHITQKGRDLK